MINIKLSNIWFNEFVFFFFIDFSTSNSKQSDKCRLFDLLTIKPTILFDIINLWPFLLHSIRWFEDLSKHSDPTDFPELKKKTTKITQTNRHRAGPLKIYIAWHATGEYGPMTIDAITPQNAFPPICWESFFFIIPLCSKFRKIVPPRQQHELMNI